MKGLERGISGAGEYLDFSHENLVYHKRDIERICVVCAEEKTMKCSENGDEAEAVTTRNEGHPETRSTFSEPEIVCLGDARTLTCGSPNGRWGDGSFNPTRYKN